MYSCSRYKQNVWQSLRETRAIWPTAASNILQLHTLKQKLPTSSFVQNVLVFRNSSNMLSTEWLHCQSAVSSSVCFILTPNFDLLTLKFNAFISPIMHRCCELSKLLSSTCEDIMLTMFWMHAWTHKLIQISTHQQDKILQHEWRTLE